MTNNNLWTQKVDKKRTHKFNNSIRFLLYISLHRRGGSNMTTAGLSSTRLSTAKRGDESVDESMDGEDTKIDI